MPRWHILLTLFACFAFANAHDLRADDPFSRSGVLLLNNGELLRGIVTLEGDRYRVSLPNGEIRIRRENVEAQFVTLDETYRHLRGKIGKPSVKAHLELARWCIRHELTESAIDELSRARLIDPNNAEAQALAEQMLRQHAAGDEQPSGTPDVRNVSTGTDGPHAPLKLPEGGMETFTRTIQPLLLNSCSASACHGPRAGNRYKLFRASRGSEQTAQLTNLNLHATLRFIDRTNPAASRLLSMATESHGERKAALLGGPTSASYRHLESWVLRLGAEPSAESAQGAPVSLNGADVILSQSIEPHARRPFDAVVPGQMRIGADDAPDSRRTVYTPRHMPAAKAQGFAATGQAPETRLDPNQFQRVRPAPWRLPPEMVERNQPALPRRKSVAEQRNGKAGSGSQLPDEFDPSIFNDRYHKPVEK